MRLRQHQTRMTKDHVIFHSTMHPRKGNSCSYLVEFNSNGMTVYGKVVCYIVPENVAYALLEERKKTGRNVSQDLPLPQETVLKDVVDRNLIGEHYLEDEEDGKPLIVSCHHIVNTVDVFLSKQGKLEVS